MVLQGLLHHTLIVLKDIHDNQGMVQQALQQMSLKDIQDNLPAVEKRLKKELGDLREVKDLLDIDIGKELLAPFKDMKTWEVCNKIPSVFKFLWTEMDTDRQGYISKKNLESSLQHIL